MLGYDHLPGATITRYCSSSVPHEWPSTRSRQARATSSSRWALEQPSRLHQGQLRQPPEAFADAEARARSSRRAASTGRTRASRCDTYVAVGRRSERRSAARLGSTSSASAARTWPRRPSTTALATRDHVTTAGGDTVEKDDGPRAVTLEAVSDLSRCSSGRRGDRGQLLARSTTRPSRCRHVRRQGQSDRADTARAHRVHGRDRALPRDHGPVRRTSRRSSART